MGQQLNKIIKRRRRAAYLKRKNELSKQGVSRKVSRVKAAPDADKKVAAKKSPVKKAAKAPAAKKVVDAAPAQDAAPTTEENS
jgi:hypothetical protein